MKQEFPYKVIKGGKTVAQASTLAEARAEAKRCGGVATAGRGYAKRNPKTERQKLEDLVWSNTHRDFRGKFADGTKAITMFVPKVGTTLVPLSQLTDAQLREQLPQGVKQRNPSSGANKNPRAMKLNQRDYTHYVVDTRTGKIVSGWSYAEDAKDAQKELVEAFPSAKGSIKVVPKRSLLAHGCTADDNSCWGNVVEMSGAKRNPSEAQHLSEARQQLMYAEDLSDRAQSKDAAGKLKDARGLWAQTLEAAAQAHENLTTIPTREATEMRRQANKLRQQAYQYLVYGAK